MPKGQKKNNNNYVKTVENLQHLLSWISSTLTFWKLDTVFPCNLIKKCCDDYYLDIENMLFPFDKKPF